MLKNLHEPTTAETGIIRRPITEVSTKVVPFEPGLAYTSPSRGHWTVAHTPILIPDSYMVYLCASACMRGVALSVLEYEGMDRFSMIMLDDKDIYEGKLEQVMIDGICEVIDRLEKHPPIMMVFTSCIHHFIACDSRYIYKTLRERYPDIDFVPCYMIPTIRKGHITPEELMHVTLYDALEVPALQEEKTINIIGSNLPANENNDYYRLLGAAGYTFRDLPKMKTYDEYKDMSKSSANLYTFPVAHRSAKKLERRLGQRGVYLPLTYHFSDISGSLRKLTTSFLLSEKHREKSCDPKTIFDELSDKEIEICFEVDKIIYQMEKEAWDALRRAKEVIGDTPIAIDHEVLPRYCSLARMLAEHGFNIKEIYADVILPEEEEDLKWLQENAPDIEFCATTNYACRMADRSQANEAKKNGQKILAIGQKAAYFTGTNHFVNWIENDGNWGFHAVCELADAMIEAYNTESDVPALIQVKALGCHCN
ncbi:MAG: nitrogenase [Eubacterium sp.]|nr:nitrogenase [Eubacterium sp.]